MAYFNQDRKKEMAPKIKTILKKYEMKGSLSVENHSTICLNLKSGKLDLIRNKERLYESINVYYTDNHFEGKNKDFLNECLKVLYEGNHNNSDVYTDYHDVGWYVSINAGRWNKPYILEK